MKDDKALRKAMSQIEAPLPNGFHSRVMEKIYQEAEYVNKKSYVMGVVLASMVSLLLITGAVYLLAVYSEFSVLGSIPRINLHFLTGPTLVYYVCFASIVIVLLTLDLLIRQIIDSPVAQQSHKNSK